MTVFESRIESVRVYHQGATVRRVVEFAADHGAPLADEVEIGRLPLALVDPTVRARLESVEPAAADLTATDVRVGLSAAPREQVAVDTERERLRQVERELLVARQSLRQIELEVEYLSCIDVPARPSAEEGKPPPPSPLAARVALEQFTDGAIRQRTDEARALRRQVKQLQQEQAEIGDRLRRASSAREAKPNELSKTAVIRLLHSGGPPPTRARLLLEYFVPGARWAPAYQCRLGRDCTAAEIQLRALVCQRSGEDWRGVELSLSTASPLEWSELPELSAIRIGRAQPAPPQRRGFRRPPRGADALFCDYDRDRELSARLLPDTPQRPLPALVVEPPQLVPETGDREPTHSAYAFAPGIEDQPPTRQMQLDDFAAAASSVMEDEELACLAEEARGSGFGVGEPTPPSLAGPTPTRRREEAPVAQAPAGSVAAPPPARSAPAMLERSKRRRRSQTNLMRTRLYEALEQDAGDVGAVVFSHLRLGSPSGDGRERGRLQPLDTREAYLQLLRRQPLDVHVDVMQVVAQAQHAAVEVVARPLPEGTSDVRQAAGHFDYHYEADAPVDVDSDGTFHSVALGTRQATSAVRYITVPREDASVFRMATLANPLAAPLLPGPVEVHVGGEYVLSTALPAVAPGGEVELGLGVEQAIKVARNTTFSETRSGTKVVAMTELHHGVAVELVNNLGRGVLCEVRERIPRPAEDAEVVVEETEVDPPWSRYSQEERRALIEGGRCWEVALGSGERRTLRASYVVKIYANNELAGGNRREA